MASRFSALFTTVFALSAPLALAATFPVAAFARQSGNSTVAPGSSIVLHLTNESSQTYTNTPPPPYVRSEVLDSGGAVIAYGANGDASLNGWTVSGSYSPYYTGDLARVTVFAPPTATPGQGYRVRFRSAYTFGPVQINPYYAYTVLYALTTAPFDVVAATAPVLTATATEADAVSLSWTDLPSETGYRVERRNATNDGWETLETLPADTTTYTNTGLTENTAYRYRVVALVGGANVESNEATVTTLYGSTGYVAVYATSTNSIRVYWQPIVGATEYRIFRSTTPGGARSATVPVGTATGESSGFYDDSGLTPETLYYYAVRVVKNGSLSAASEEDAHFPNANAIPWNSSASAILSKARQVISAMNPSVNPSVIDSLPLRLAAPNGIVYDDASSQPLPRDGVFNLETGTINVGDNIYPVNPDFFSWQEDTVIPPPSVPTPQMQRGMMTPTEDYQSPQQSGGVDASALGGIRRVRSTETISNSIMLQVSGVSGTFRIPRYSLSQFPAQRDMNVGTYGIPNPHLYLGFHSPQGRFGVDAGIQFNHAQGNLPDRWQATLRVSDGRPKKDQYIGNGIEIRPVGAQNSIPMRTFPTPPDYVSLDTHIDIRSRLCSLVVNVHATPGAEDSDFEPLPGSALLGVTVSAIVKAGSRQYLLPLTQAKRVMSLDQQFRIPLAITRFDNAQGNQTTNAFYDDNSFMRRVLWFGGKLYSRNSSYDWIPSLVAPAVPGTSFNPTNHNQPSWYRSRTNGVYIVNVRDTMSGDINGSPSNEQVDINH